MNNRIYEKEILPHFRLSESYYERDDEGYYRRKVIQITNHGGNYYMFESKVLSFIHFEQKGITYALPVIILCHRLLMQTA